MKSLFLIITVLVTVTSYAQTDDFNLKKYWKFRNTFVEQFVKIGKADGESLPAGKRKPCNCIDNLYLNPQGVPDCYGEMHWGDGMIRHGHYLGFLATEYALLKKYGQETTATLHELYYALNAINRVDKFAEPLLAPIYNFSTPENLNGFYLREDIPEDFASEFSDGDWDMRCTNSAFYHNNNAAKINNPSLSYKPEVKGLSYLNAPSLDQMSSLLVGLSVAHKLVDNVFVQPTSSDTGFSIKTEIEAITDRIVAYAADRNWELIDVNGWPVANGGGDLAFTAFPIAQCAYNMFGGLYIQEMKRKTSAYPYIADIRVCLTGFGVENNEPETQDTACMNVGILGQTDLFNLSPGAQAGSMNNQNNSLYQSWSSYGGNTTLPVNSPGVVYLWTELLPNSYADLQADWENDYRLNQTFNAPLSWIKMEKSQGFSHYNTLIYFNLAVAGGLWTQQQAHEFADIGDNRQLELVNALLKDDSPVEDKAFYKAYLDQMPMSGSYHLSGKSGNVKDSLFASGWATSYRWAKDLDANLGNEGDDNGNGIYNGLDYMYFHNLYYLFFGNEIADPFEKKYECFCDFDVEKPIPTGLGVTIDDIQATQDLNKKLAFVGSCVENVFTPVNNDVYGAFSIEPFFSEYIDAGIRPSKYQTENATIHSGANVQVQTDFVICAAKTLTTEANSELVLNNGHLIIKGNSTLDVSGTVRIKAGNRIDFDPMGKIILRSGAKLIIEDEAKFLLNYVGKLEFYDGAQIIMEGANSEFILRGGVVMMDGGTFSLDHSASPESGRLIVEANVGFLRGIGNTNPCFVELYGKDADDEFIILKKDKSITQYDSNTPQYIDKLTIHHCKVRFEENAKITSYQPFIAYQTTFESDVNNNGIQIGDQNNFSSCNFYDVPVQADLFVENTDKFNATNCKFWSKSDINEQDRPLVYVNGMGFDIYSCEFKGSEHACLRSENLLHQSTIANSSFEHYDGYTPGTSMVGIHDVSNVEVKLLNNTIGQTKIGVSKVGGELSLKCNTFAYNDQYHVLGAFGCHVNLSTDIGGGYNDFFAHPDVCISLNSAMISMNNGRNRFHDFLYYVKGDVISQCGTNTDCAINASKNQWNIGNVYQLDPPQQSKFDVVGSDNLPFQFSANLTQLFPPCGYYDNGDPSEGTGQSGYPTAGTNDYIVNLPMISLSFNSNISLDDAVIYADRLSGLGQDVQAIEIYDEIFDLNLTKDDQTSTWLYRALSGMKSSLENAMFEENLLKGDNIVNFESHVQSYVDALNYMSDMSIQGDNYKEQFYLEIEKSHLYRMLEIDQMSNEVLSHIDVCGLDQEEQAMLNYWKTQYDIDLIVNQIGYAYLDSTIAVDTSGYNVPTSYTPPIFNFGSQINGVYNISYTSCASGNAKMNALANRPMNELSVHPNPADKFIDVQFDFEELEGEADIRITSLDGKEVIRLTHDFESKGNILSFDVSNWKQGGYLITARTATLGILQKQFVVTH